MNKKLLIEAFVASDADDGVIRSAIIELTPAFVLIVENMRRLVVECGLREASAECTVRWCGPVEYDPTDSWMSVDRETVIFCREANEREGTPRFVTATIDVSELRESLRHPESMTRVGLDGHLDHLPYLSESFGTTLISTLVH